MKRHDVLGTSTWAWLILLVFVAACSSEAPQGSPPTSLSRDDYTDRLRAMWLAECIANWTGLVTENMRRGPPFFTDEDWGTRKGNPEMNGGVIDFVFQTPWGADDDTDIEYIYLDAMVRQGGTELGPEEIREAWLNHIEPGSYVWVSNNEARNLMGAPIYTLPPSTSLLAANDQSLMIDAQLTTEIFGALAPGMPERALILSDLPIRVTASGFAAHASQFYAALYSLAAVAGPGQTVRQRILWMVETARSLIPDTSKTADVIDFVLEDYLGNPDVDDWERTRDAVAERYQLNDEENGFKYIGFAESSINLATGLIALLYGQGDIRRTIQIGSLSGWDSDNGTATMGGLLGLMLGSDAIHAAFPDVELSDYYDILRTRMGFEPPHCMDWHPNCLDTFTDMAERMIPLVEMEILAGGGDVDEKRGVWSLPRIDYKDLSAEKNPLTKLDRSSANNRLLRIGDVPKISWSGILFVLSGPSGDGGSEIADGLEFDFSGVDRRLPVRGIVPMFLGFPGKQYHALVLPWGETIEVSVTWQEPLTLQGVRFIEGPPHVLGGLAGAFNSLTVNVQVGNNWIEVEGPPSSGEPDPSTAFEVVEWDLSLPVEATGVRLVGSLTESAWFVTVAELEGIL